LKSVAEPCSLAHTRICKFAFTSLKQVRELPGHHFVLYARHVAAMLEEEKPNLGQAYRGAHIA